MIEFADSTLRETGGFYDEVVKLMKEEGEPSEWMLRSSAFVSNELVAQSYILHFWADGRVVIYETDRSMKLDSIDEELRELSQWCRDAGWKYLGVNDRLLNDRHALEFWKRAHIAGLVVNETLQQYEDEELIRLSKAYLKEKEEEAHATDANE